MACRAAARETRPTAGTPQTVKPFQAARQEDGPIAGRAPGGT